MRYIDTHVHYDHRRFKTEARSEMMQKIEACDDIAWVVNATIGQDSMFNMREKLAEYSKVYFTAGKHPTAAARDDFGSESMKQHMAHMAREARTVAIGETGIDTYRCHEKAQIENQKKWFHFCMDLSEKVQKPLILHIRGKRACKIALREMRAHGTDNLRGVFHCFCSDYRTYKKCAACGDFYFGIGGTLLRAGKEQKRLRRAVKKMPLERMVTETDCPFLKPDGYADKINDSFAVPLVIAEIARIKHMDEDAVAQVLFDNALRLFGLPDDK